VLASELPAHFRVNGIRVSEKGSVKEIDKGLDPELFRPKSGVDPDDVARTVLFLLSSEAAGVNGQILDIS
jgi:NAD(P)-dependent dehydrogenase (short-subunit alcohol dehydrogenase family)